MLTTDNFIAFFTVCGFFIGLIFSILNFINAFDILFYTIIITFLFFVGIHIAVINFIDIEKIGAKFFDKNSYEAVSDYFINELQIRERRIEHLINEEPDGSNTIKLRSKKKKNAVKKNQAA